MRRFLTALVIAVLLCGAATLSFGQTGTEPAHKDKPKTEAPDNWQKSKQCADQAEKVIKEAKAELTSGEEIVWSNHYSPKYNTCFLKETIFGGEVGPPAYNYTITTLIDAFERIERVRIHSGMTVDGKHYRDCFLERILARASCERADALLYDYMNN